MRTKEKIIEELFDLECELDEWCHDDPFSSMPLFIIEERSKIVDKMNILRKELEKINSKAK